MWSSGRASKLAVIIRRSISMICTNPYPSTCCFITQTVTMNKSLFETSVPQLNFGEILFGHPMEVKRTARKIEKLLYKANSVSTAISFNEMCLKEGLLPRYSIYTIYKNCICLYVCMYVCVCVCV